MKLHSKKLALQGQNRCNSYWKKIVLRFYNDGFIAFFIILTNLFSRDKHLLSSMAIYSFRFIYFTLHQPLSKIYLLSTVFIQFESQPPENTVYQQIAYSFAIHHRFQFCNLHQFYMQSRTVNQTLRSQYTELSLLSCVMRAYVTRILLSVQVNSVLKSSSAHLPIHTVLLQSHEEDIKPGSTNLNNFFEVDICRQSIKTGKIWLTFFKFQYMSILAIRRWAPVAIHCSRRQEMILMPEYNLKRQN